MKAYNCECLGCGFKADRIVKGNEVIKCKCDQVMSKVGGPIGGSNILPLSIGQPDRFIAFESSTLGRKINTEIELKAAYDEMYAVTCVLTPRSSAEKVEELKPAKGEPKKLGRPKKKLNFVEEDTESSEGYDV